MSKLTFCFALASVVTLFAAAALGQPKDIPLPSDVAVEAPAAAVPKPLAAFSGKWFGQYNGVNTGAYMSDGLIVVEKIVSPTEIQVFYSGIGRHSWNYGKPWSYRVKASFSNGELEFEAGDTCVIKARMTSDERMTTTKTCGTGSNRGSYKRISQ